MSRHFYAATLVVCLLVTGCSRPGGQRTVATSSQEAPPNAASAAVLSEDLVVGQPFTYRNLTVFPIVSKTPKDNDRFVTLDEGFAAGTVTITEVGAGTADVEPAIQGDTEESPSNHRATPDEDPFQSPEPAEDIQGARIQSQPANSSVTRDTGSPSREPSAMENEAASSATVNQLWVLNASDRPLYIMPGEVISGGLQDRTIGQELVIQPAKKPVPIEVYCVEQGRWSGRRITATAQPSTWADDSPADTDHVDTLTTDARSGKFAVRVGNLGKDARLAVQQSQDQGAVWDAVAKTHAKFRTDSATGNFADVYSEPEISQEVERYTQALKPIVDTERIVGFAVAIDGRMLSADIFESTPLLRKFAAKLMKSYALDAMGTADEAHPATACTVAACVRFLKEAAEAQGQTESIAAGQMTARRESERSVSFSYYNANGLGARSTQPTTAAGPYRMGGMGGGLMGGAVHSGAFSK